MTTRAQRRFPELEQPCAWCHAIPGEQCTRARNEPRREPHPGRRDAWVATHTDCPACHAPAGTGCIAPTGFPFPGVHPQRAQVAADTYRQALEADSRDVPERRR
ncbi:zinc finger domain-containing protein [Streptomyces sp. NPDC001588]